MDQSSELRTTKGAVKSQTTTALPNFIQDHDKGLPKNEIPPTVFNFFYFIYLMCSCDCSENEHPLSMFIDCLHFNIFLI